MGMRSAHPHLKNSLQQQRYPQHFCGNVGHSIQQVIKQHKAAQPHQHAEDDEKLPSPNQRIATKKNKS